ncbi:GNAT family N-acetyltransferase [Arthrobacter sp. HLT1-21]
MTSLRAVEPSDLDEFFTHQLDPSANHMAAFTAKNPADRGVFNHHWQNILNDPQITVRTILNDGAVVGSILAYRNDETPEISYWIDKAQWGQGITTAAVGLFLEEFTDRPIRARAVVDNVNSIKILERYGFEHIGEVQGFANARGAVVKELVLELR